MDEKNRRNDVYCHRLVNDGVLVTRTNYVPVCKKTKSSRTKFKVDVVWDYPATAVTSFDSNGHYTKFNYSRTALQTSYNKALTDKLNSINPPKVVGDHNGDTILGHCAEPHAANQTMNAYSKAKHKDLPLEDIFFSLAKRPRTMEIVPTCQNCKDTFPNL